MKGTMPTLALAMLVLLLCVNPSASQVDSSKIRLLLIGDVTLGESPIQEWLRDDPAMTYESGRPSFCVWKFVGDQFLNIWEYHGEGMPSVDIGDPDGDGHGEIVTGSERGVSIWKYQPEIIYEGRILEQGGYFYRLWEETESQVKVMDLCLRVGIVDSSGKDQVIVVGREMEKQNFFLYTVERGEVGYVSRIIPLWENARPFCPTMDIWPIVSIAEPPWMIFVLTASLIGSLRGSGRRTAPS